MSNGIVPVCRRGKYLAARAISIQVGKRNPWVGNTIKELLDDCVGVPIVYRGRLIMYYPPCAIPVLKLIIELVPKARDGWKTRHDLVKASNGHLSWRAAKTLLDPYFEESVIMRDKRGRNFRYYPPELIALIPFS